MDFDFDRLEHIIKKWCAELKENKRKRKFDARRAADSILKLDVEIVPWLDFNLCPQIHRY